MKKAVLLLTLFAMLVTGSAVTAAPPSQAPDGEAYIVQPGDWLRKIAEKFYGEADAHRAIVEATNAKAAEDASFAVIDNPSFIRVGQKLWIPTPETATEVVAYVPPVPSETQDGQCWVNFLNSPYSWSCMVGNSIFEPCLTAADGETIVCNINPLDESEHFALNLTEPLPEPEDARPDAPVSWTTWLLELDDGVTCGLLSGAGIGFDEKRVNYGCTDETSILGEPQTGTVWTVEQIEVGHNEDGFFIETSEIVPVVRAWQPGDPTAAGEGLTLEALQNAAYQGIYDEPVQLTDGKYEGEPFVPGGASRPTVTFHPEVYAFGDLNGDGMDDAAVILIESSGGSGNFRYLAAVINEDGTPVNVATAFVGDREQVQAISIDGNEITVDMVAHGPDDPMCCPTQEVTKVYQLQDDQLVEVLVGLEGALWTLVSYGEADDPQAVLEGSEITAEFDPDEGTVHGSAGCNSYFGAYEVDGDGLTVGPVGSTEMHCMDPENVMDQETTYLAALQSAASYKIEDGQLHVTSADGATVLTFAVMEATSLTGTTWQLISYLHDDAFTSVLTDTEITAVFGDDGRVTGSAGCNSYFGSYEVDGEEITFGLLGSTLMACPDPEGVMDQEQTYLAALGSAVTYHIEGDELELIDADGTRVAQFVALPPASLGGTEWTLTAYNNGQGAVVSVLIGTEITAVLGDDGRVSGSAGCNTYGASYEVDGDQITIGPAVTTRMWCPEPEGVMDQESAFLAALESAVTYHIQGDKLEMRSADGALALQFTAVSEATPTEPATGEAYVVQPGDWLMKIAEKFYGDANAYHAIVEATNAKAAEDATFSVIDNPSLIRVGQKLWIPAQSVATGGELTLGALQNAVYQGIYDEPVQLTDGKYEGEPFVPGGASRPTVTFHPEVYAFGDLNGDGVEDAAVILIESSGGSGNFRYLAAVINEDGAPVNVATQFVGDREQVQAISIEDGVITLQLVAHGPDDPMCCPTQEVTKVYRLQDDQLVEV